MRNMGFKKRFNCKSIFWMIWPFDFRVRYSGKIGEMSEYSAYSLFIAGSFWLDIDEKVSCIPLIHSETDSSVTPISA